MTRALHTFGALFGGATAYPKARGVWRDHERGGALVFDDPVIIHSYVRRSDLDDDARMSQLGAFCRAMGRQTRQGEIGLIADGEYLAFRNFEEST